MGGSWVPLPPGGALIGHQGALLDGKECYISAVCGPIWLILWLHMQFGPQIPNLRSDLTSEAVVASEASKRLVVRTSDLKSGVRFYL